MIHPTAIVDPSARVAQADRHEDSPLEDLEHAAMSCDRHPVAFSEHDGSARSGSLSFAKAARKAVDQVNVKRVQGSY